MAGSWLVSYIVLWTITIALALLALSHSRLLGLLYQRIGPAVSRPTQDGPSVGTRIAEIEATTMFGRPWVRRFPTATSSLVIFVSPQCQACNELMPHVRDFRDRFRTQCDVLLLSVLGDPALNRAYVDFAKLHDTPYLIADRFAAKVEVAGTPYGFKLDKNGVILAKGIVNHFEHLVSLWNVTSDLESQEEQITEGGGPQQEITA